jgi:hypothetical protein
MYATGIVDRGRVMNKDGSISIAPSRIVLCACLAKNPSARHGHGPLIATCSHLRFGICNCLAPALDSCLTELTRFMEMS